MRRKTPLVVIACLLVAMAVAGQPGRLDAAPSGDALREQILGVLEHARVDVDLADVPVREALDRLGDAIGVKIIGRYETDPVGHGMDPTMPITLNLTDVSGRDALEMIIDQASLSASCTWQMRTGFVEVGTKRRLGASNERRVHELTDMLLEPAYFDSGRGLSPIDRNHFNNHPYRPASVKIGRWQPRWDGRQLLEELIRAIVEVVDPGNWDFELSSPPPTGRWRGVHGRGSGGTPYHSGSGKVARIRQWSDKQLMVIAPDYFHRQVSGMGSVQVPRASYPEERTTAQPGIRCTRIDMKSAAAAVSPFAATRPGEITGRMLDSGFRTRAAEALFQTPVHVSFDGTPLRTAIAELERQLGLPVVGRFKDDDLGYGMDPDLPVTLHLHDVAAIDVMRLLLEVAASSGEACEWQVRRGYIELGTKARLSVPAARSLHLYYIRDLMIEPPSIGRKRKLPEGVALDRVETIVTTIEPDAWDWGQVEYDDDDPNRNVTIGAPRRTGTGRSQQPGPGNSAPQFIEAEKPAIIRHWRDVLIVLAPDYIHRQLGGYDAGGDGSLTGER